MQPHLAIKLNAETNGGGGMPTTNPNKALWEKGDFTRIAESMRDSGVALVQRIGIRKGMKVLDLGCGDGTTAVPAAKLGADVLGVDIVPKLVQAGNLRAQEMGLTNLRFQEGDATNLQELKSRSFDLVMSFFGATYAPRPNDVAKEMVRVTRSGGRIVMGNWIPTESNLMVQILKICAPYTPPSVGLPVSPMTWGIESFVKERFTGAGVFPEKIQFTKDTYMFNYPEQPTVLVEQFRKFDPPTMIAFEGAEKNGKAAQLQKQLEDLFISQNRSAQKDLTSIPATFLRVTIEV
jgi:ubiquinone/menaquinone biosynthesis C-methylase UbiE